MMRTVLKQTEKMDDGDQATAPSPELEATAVTADTPLTTPNGREVAREDFARKAEDVTPTGAILPRPWEEYRLEGEFTRHEALMDAVEGALEDVTLTPQRYAELMWLLDSWFVEGRHETRCATIAEGKRRFTGG